MENHSTFTGVKTYLALWRCPCYPKKYTDSMQCYENEDCIFGRNPRKILKLLWILKGPWQAKIIFKEENQDGSLTLLDFKTCYKVTVINTV